jgi:hypothetical protein
VSAQIPVHLSCGRWPHESPDRAEFYDASQPRDWAGRWTRGGAPVAVSRAASQAKNGYLDLIGNTARTTDDEFSRVQVDPERARRIAEAYVALPEVDETAKPAYQALRKELKKQYRFMLASGIKVVVQDTDPYPSVRELIADVEENKTLRVLSTASTGGHPFFSDAENDIFRAVHDFYGHAATGRDFSRHGEEAAYLAHAEMFSPLARRALTTETRGQNSMLNFGPDKGEFPVQKLALLPEEFSDPASVTIASKPLSSVTSSATTPLEFYVGETLSAIIELACHSAECRPPTSGGTGGSLPGDTVSTRRPSAVSATKELKGQTTGWGEVPEEHKVKMATVMAATVDGFKDLSPSDFETPSEFVDAVLDRIATNTEEVFDRATPDQVDEWRQWYAGASALSESWAKTTGLDPKQVAAAIATLSPGTVWDHNVEMARHVIEWGTTRKHEPLAPEHIERLNGLLAEADKRSMDAYEKASAAAAVIRKQGETLLGASDQVTAKKALKELVGDKKWSQDALAAKRLIASDRYEEITPTLGKLREIMADPSLSTKERNAALKPIREELGEDYKDARSLVSLGIAKSKKTVSKPELNGRLDPTKVHVIADMPNSLAGLAVRAIIGDGATVPHMKVTKDGEPYFEGLLMTNAGAPTKLRWQSMGNLGKAMAVIRSNDLQVISDQLGEAHKVRNFYNNIVDPSDPTSFTADTHAYGIAFGIPVGVSHPYISTSTKKGGPKAQNLPGRPSDTATGFLGVYALTQEGYRRAVDRVNARKGGPNPPLLLREYQSVTWEQWRHDYPASSRATRNSTTTKGATDMVQDVLARRDRGEITYPQAKAEIASIRADIKEKFKGKDTDLIDESPEEGVDFGV